MELSNEIKTQISNEAEANVKNFKDNNDFQAGKIEGYKEGYEIAGEIYADKWQEAEAERITVTLERNMLKLENQRLRKTIEEIRQQIATLRKEIVDMLTPKLNTNEKTTIPGS